MKKISRLFFTVLLLMFTQIVARASEDDCILLDTNKGIMLFCTSNYLNQSGTVPLTLHIKDGNYEFVGKIEKSRFNQFISDYRSYKGLVLDKKENNYEYSIIKTAWTDVYIEKYMIYQIDDYFVAFIKPLNDDFVKTANNNTSNDELFYDLQKKYVGIVEKMNEQHISIGGSKNTSWYKLDSAEGSEYFSPNWNYLKTKYGRYISTSYNNWLSFLIKEGNVVEDAGLLVKPDDIRKHILYLEKFIKDNSGFVAINDVKDKLEGFLYLYTIGTDNTPIFDIEEPKVMDKNYKISYEIFLQENQDSKYYAMIKELYDNSKKYDFKNTKKFKKWYDNVFYNKYFNN